MGVLPWVMLMLISLSTLSLVQTKQLIDQNHLLFFDQYSSLANYKDYASEYNTKAFIRAIQSEQSSEVHYILIGSPKYPEALEKGYVHHNKGSIGKKRPLSDQKRAPLSRFLHFNELFSGNVDETPRKKSEFALFTRFLQKKYQALFSDLHNGVIGSQAESHDFIRELFQKITDLRKTLPIKKSKRLANIECDDPKNAYALYRILAGGSCLYGNQEIQLPRLTDIVSMKKRGEILCLYIASIPILEAVLDSPDAVQIILREREAIYSTFKKMKIEERESQKAQLEEEFRSRTLQYISSDIDPQFISFRVSQTDPNKSIRNRL